MKLRSLTLENVRRFDGQRAHLPGIGDGLTVVSEANEFGKSTFFDALHALFFIRHGSSAAAVKSLQPHAGGPVRVVAEIDLPEGRFTLSKTYLARKTAEIARGADGTVIARGGEADDWIEALLARMAGGAGPTGLLWVRQGATALDRRDSAQATARRDLLSSVAGEIEEMTGGRGMDRILRQARAALAEIATPGRGSPKGPRKAVEDALAEARTELEALTRDCADLSEALTERTRTLTELSRLTEPEVATRQARDLAQAEEAHAAAEAHARQVAEAETAVGVARLEHEAATRQMQALATQAAERDAAAKARDTAAQALETARSGEEAAARRLSEARSAAEAAEASCTTLRTERDVAQRAVLRDRAAQEVARLCEALAGTEHHLETARTRKAQAEALATTPQRLRAAEEAVRRLEMVRMQQAAQAVHLRMWHSGTARATLDGAQMPEDTAVPLTRDAVLDLPGLGELRITLPGTEAETGAADLRQAEEAARAALRACGSDRLEEARRQADTRAEHLAAADTALQLAATLAPEGRDALAEALAQARLHAGPEDVESPASSDAAPPRALPDIVIALEDAEAALATARTALEGARDTHATAKAASSGAEAALAAADARLRAAQEQIGTPEDHAARSADAAEACAQTRTRLQHAGEALADLRAAAPDTETARANLMRAQSARDSTRARIGELERALVGLETRIALRADTDVEARRAELADHVAALEARAQSYAEEVAALQMLIDSLQQARAAARDVYFGPVQAEMRPLLALLHGSAELGWEDDALLPGALDRGGVREDFDTLSGGTQEQIAILTRLAFARLYGRGGTHIPVILDDALVYSDDDRIVQMFTALNRVAMDQQVIVFTCRQMAFRELGGTRPRVEITRLD